MDSVERWRFPGTLRISFDAYLHENHNSKQVVFSKNAGSFTDSTGHRLGLKSRWFMEALTRVTACLELVETPITSSKHSSDVSARPPFCISKAWLLTTKEKLCNLRASFLLFPPASV